MKFKKDADGKLELDDKGDPIATDEAGEVLDLTKLVSAGKLQRVEGERDEYKTQLGTLQTEVEGLKASAGNAEELKSKVDELTAGTTKLQTEFEAKMAARDKEHALETTLLTAGVKPEALKAAKAYVDLDTIKVADGKLSGLDLEAFKKDQAFLFDATTTVSTAAATSGAAGQSEEDAKLAAAREAAGLPPKKP